jgi:hypothetical protein
MLQGTQGSEDLLLGHDWVLDQCEGRDACYLIVAVAGWRTLSRYSIIESTPDATITLTSGVPLRAHVASNRMQYFKYSLTQKDLGMCSCVLVLLCYCVIVLL